MFIQTEETPNPATLKFLPGKTIISKGTLEFKNKSEAKDFELAPKLIKKIVSVVMSSFIISP